MSLDTFITAKEALQAERDGQRQILSFGPWLRMDESKIPAGSEDLCKRVLNFAHLRSPEYGRLLSEPEVNRLFVAGTLYFESSARDSGANSG